MVETVRELVPKLDVYVLRKSFLPQLEGKE